MRPLNAVTAGQVTRPNKAGILHIGLGQFAKAHLAVYTHGVISAGARQWGIVGLSLRNPDMMNKLAEQDWLYSVLAEGDDFRQQTVIGSLLSGLSLTQNTRQEMLDAFLNPDLRVVTLTITEKGYYQNSDGDLDVHHPDIVFDIEHPESPKTALGWLVLGLHSRFEKALPLFTPLTLDNLNRNGEVLKRMVTTLARTLNADLAKRIESDVPFPSTMVDRIVPAVDAATLSSVSKQLGFEDNVGVATEQYSQWVIEDNFVSGRPNWDEVGALFCDDVTPFEQAKLKMLNGTHSALAYLGCLLELETVADCIKHEDLHRYLRLLMSQELLPEVVIPDGFDLHRYSEDLFRRFENPHLRHRCAQIAMDGSQKIPQRLLPVIEARLASQRPIDALVLAIAGWIQFVRISNKLSDPMAGDLKAICERAPEGELGRYFVERSGVFSLGLRQSDSFLGQLQGCLDALERTTLLDVLKKTSKVR